ncbi:glycosyl transferase [Aquimarina addita]|uniref:Glycosyl transferase n=1 Tax=Aquimarina addita TaxID=870485 RepID=A0ABP6UJ10_9FLAO
MKVKELPISLYKTVRLRLIPVKKLLETKKEEIPIIVSLTTIPSRVEKVHITIRSILTQTKKPEKIVLWLPEDLKEMIPDNLTVLQGSVFEIRFSHLTCSHKKLIHSLKEFPDTTIVTCDDDFIYHKNWLSYLYNQHLIYPSAIIANQVRMIRYDDKGDLLPYHQWVYTEAFKKDNKCVLPIGANGILYPPESLHKTVFDESLFLQLTPKADDLWFKAMGLLNNTESRLSEQIPPIPVPIIGTQHISLKRENIGKGKNVTQWKALQEHFGFKI